MWLLTRTDKSSIYWAQEVQNIAVRRSEMIARNTIGTMPRSVMQLFPVIFLMSAMILPAAAQQRQWTPDDLDLRSPFGDIPTGTANRSQRDFHIFFDSLSIQERAEIRARCGVIGSDRRFATWAREICAQVEQTQDSTELQIRQIIR
jgi:hypothetical protein